MTSGPSGGIAIGTANDMALARRAYVTSVLFLVYMFSSIDRFIISTLLEPIKHDLDLTDSQTGLIAGAFALFYIIAGVPLGIAVDRCNRRNLLALCMVIWSIMTLLCSLARSYHMLLLARLGVGIGEAGGGPASMAMMADLYPPEKRTFWISILYMATPTGAMIAVSAGAWIAADYGWRSAMTAAALPAVALVPMLLLGVRDPGRGRPSGPGAGSAASTPLRDSLAFIWSQRALRHILIGLTVIGFISNGVGSWLISFLVRSHDFSLKQAGFVLATCYGPLNIAGILLCGALANWTGQRDSRWQGAAICISWAAMMLFLIFAVLATTGTAAAGSLFAAYFLGAGSWGVAYALCQSLVPANMRGLTMALTYGGIAAGAVSPRVIGSISDATAAHYGHDSLRYAILAVSLLGPWAVVHFLLAIPHIPRDLARIDQ
jgi:predicted MFS family arabinose efflux permease